jgi:gamma-glutamylcyclotransferase
MSVRYFAYGSNMQRATFRGRRGIRPLSAVPARVPGWRLVLDKPSIIPRRQSFASLVPEAEAVVYGVLYELTDDDYAHVELTEAVPLGNYQRVDVEAHPLVDGVAPCRARTLASDRREPTLRPSARYLGLIIEGAEEHGLPAEWIAYLRGIPSVEESAEDIELRRQLDELMRAVASTRPRR